MTAYASRDRYKYALREGAPRRDLSGQTVGAVTAEQAAHALQCLEAVDARRQRHGKAAPQGNLKVEAEKPVKAKSQSRKANTPGANPPNPKPPTPVEEPKPTPQPRETVKPGPVVVILKKRSRDTTTPRQRLYDLTTK